MRFLNVVRGTLPALNSRAAHQFKKYYFADRPVDLAEIREFRGDAFPASGPLCWLDQPDALAEVERKRCEGLITDADAAMCKQWIFRGYLIVNALIPDAELDEAWQAYEKAIEEGVITVDPEPHGPDDPYPGRRLDPHRQIPAIRKLQHHPKILHITNLLFGVKSLPFQTIMGHKGSAQHAHSDTIHMTTYPLGYLIANWIAFEDIHEDSGPLEYYPFSHRVVPTALSRDVGIAPEEFKKGGYSIYSERYEPHIRNCIEASRLKPEYFLAKKGDVLFWHANLLHGGAPRRNLQLSRKALVCHYFAEGAVTYHDLSGNPSRLHRNGMYAPPVIDEG
ncbi:MAG TPA: phytanoyl-CoA dioxygenase family protein [Beijerinckiaceae bacterium]|nr:phytanoyl-CoA dioxygenase family protein [Beijerinckiaceae bacterium]